MIKKKEPFSEKLKSHMLDIMVVLLIVGVGYVIFQEKKHEKETTSKTQIGKMVNDFRSVNTR